MVAEAEVKMAASAAPLDKSPSCPGSSPAAAAGGSSEILLATHDVHGLAVSNVLHWFMLPESSPVRNHRTRWAEEP